MSFYTDQARYYLAQARAWRIAGNARMALTYLDCAATSRKAHVIYLAEMAP